MEGKTKILWLSDLVTPTGFSRVSHSIIDFLPREEYDILGLGVNYYGDPHEYNFPIFPAGVSRDVYGISRLSDVTKHNPNLIFILNDAWVVNDYLRALKEIYKDKDRPKIVVYTPVDAKEHDSDWYKDFDIVDQLVLYTEFARMVVSKAAPQLETVVIPHGVDKTKFYKMNVDRAQLKKEYFKGKIDNPEELFIFFSGQRNQPRKRLDITMDAFKLFSENKPDNVRLYMHAGIKDAHIDLIKYSKRLGIDHRLLVTNMGMGTQAISVEKLNLIYNLTEVGLNSSIGEGWSLINQEHTMTGAPQIVPNHSALADLYADCGILVEPSYKFVQNHIMTVGEVISPEDMADAMEIIYTDKKLYKTLSKAGIDKFSSDEYSWKTVAGMFDKVFKEVLNK